MEESNNQLSGILSEIRNPVFKPLSSLKKEQGGGTYKVQRAASNIPMLEKLTKKKGRRRG